MSFSQIKKVIIPQCKWDLTTNLINKQNRLEQYHKNKEILEKMNYGCMCNVDKESEQCGSNYKIIRRIGSDSLDAEVYEVKILPSQIKVAMKLLPILDKTSLDKNVNELEIA